MRENDLSFLQQLRNDVPLQRAAMAIARGSTSSEVENWIERRRTDSSSLLRVVSDASSDAPCGYIQLTGIIREQGRAWLGLCLGREHQGRGLGAEAVALMENYAREVLGLKKILLEVLAVNTAARRLYAGAGYREVGTLREHFRGPGESQAEDAVLMEKVLSQPS